MNNRTDQRNQKGFCQATKVRMHLASVSDQKPAALWKQGNEKSWTKMMKVKDTSSSGVKTQLRCNPLTYSPC